MKCNDIGTIDLQDSLRVGFSYYLLYSCAVSVFYRVLCELCW